jgi:hypothetical protein
MWQPIETAPKDQFLLLVWPFRIHDDADGGYVGAHV